MCDMIENLTIPDGYEVDRIATPGRCDTILSPHGTVWVAGPADRVRLSVILKRVETATEQSERVLAEALEQCRCPAFMGRYVTVNGSGAVHIHESEPRSYELSYWKSPGHTLFIYRGERPRLTVHCCKEID